MHVWNVSFKDTKVITIRTLYVLESANFGGRFLQPRYTRPNINRAINLVKGRRKISEREGDGEKGEREREKRKGRGKEKGKK